MAEESGSHTELTVFLEGGAIFKLETNKGDALVLLKKFAEAVDIDKLDTRMQGK